jgi:hypothetical protein
MDNDEQAKTTQTEVGGRYGETSNKVIATEDTKTPITVSIKDWFSLDYKEV